MRLNGFSTCITDRTDNKRYYILFKVDRDMYKLDIKTYSCDDEECQYKVFPSDLNLYS